MDIPRFICIKVFTRRVDRCNSWLGNKLRKSFRSCELKFQCHKSFSCARRTVVSLAHRVHCPLRIPSAVRPRPTRILQLVVRVVVSSISSSLLLCRCVVAVARWWCRVVAEKVENQSQLYARSSYEWSETFRAVFSNRNPDAEFN